MLFFFFFQAEDGIRDGHVTGVQTCALPIWPRRPRRGAAAHPVDPGSAGPAHRAGRHQGRGGRTLLALRRCRVDHHLHGGLPDPMSAHAPGPPHAAEAELTAHEHASVRTYVRVAIVLTLVTAMEVGVIYIRALTPIVVPLLLVMAAAKFALVVMFFMHLRYDGRGLTTLFLGPLLIATLLAIALMTLTGAFLIFGR